MSGQYFEKMHWGAGQPETIRDFNINAETPEGEKILAQVRDHWQRRWSLKLNSQIFVTKLRVEILSTWGLDHARIMQVAVRQ